MAETVKSLLTKRETQIRSWGSFSWRREWLHTAVCLPGEFHGQRSLEGYSPWDRKLSGQDWAHTLLYFIWHYSEPYLSNAALLHHFLKLSTTSVIRHKTDSECRGEDMESGAWEQGAGSGLHRSWGRERCKSQRHGSAFICITRMQCTQYSFYLLFQFIIIFFKCSILKNEPSSS